MRTTINLAGALALALTMSATVTFAAVGSALGANCDAQHASICQAVPGTTYEGTAKVHPTIKVDACFTAREAGLITRPDGTNEWIMYLVYPNGVFEKIRTMRNTDCKVGQYLTPGTRIAVFVTCKEYYGWVATDPVAADGKYVMDRVSWEYDPTL